MATKTDNLALIKPANGEYFNVWDQPLNKNWDVIDQAVGDLQLETESSRGSQASLDDRLSVALNADGSLKPVPEVLRARSSSVYGYTDGVTDFDLDTRIEQADREIFDARQQLDTLRDTLAFMQDDNVPNSIISAPVGALSFTGAQLKLDGSVTPFVANINGYRQVVRTLKSVTVSGVAGTYYAYLDLSLAGEIILDRTGGGQNTGVTSEYPALSGVYGKFTDSTQNFSTSGVQPGDILEITTGASVNKGQYIVQAVLSTTELQIIGTFVSVQATLNYKITNPIAPVFNYTAIAHSKAFVRDSGRIYIGRLVFDGANITGVSNYAVKGRFVEFQSVTPVGGDFSLTVAHGLGYVPSKISLYGSQASDYSVPLEPLSIAELSVGGGLLQRSVIANMDDTTIQIKNATNGVFYRDFGGTTQTAGFLLVVAER